MDLIRQGDLLFIRLGAPPARAGEHDAVLAHGEATGHMHRIDSADLSHTDVYVDATGRVIVHVRPDRATRVVHEEHDPIELLPGAWEVRRQREYVPEGWRRVAD